MAGRTSSRPTRRQYGYAVGIGLAAGVTSGLLGVGGGVVLVPGMVALLKLGQREAIANSLAAIIPASAVGAVVYYFGAPKPHVRLDLGVVLAVGGIAGAFLGARLAQKVSERTLRIGFAVLMLAIGVRLLLVGNSA